MSARAKALGGRAAAMAATLAAAPVAVSAVHGVSGGCCKNCSNLCNFCCKNVQQLHWCWVRWTAAAIVVGKAQKSIGPAVQRARLLGARGGSHRRWRSATVREGAEGVPEWWKATSVIGASRGCRSSAAQVVSGPGRQRAGRQRPGH